MQKKTWIKNSHGQRIASVIHMPVKRPAPAIIVCHGFTSSKYTKEDICKLLASKGFVAVRFDFNGHGESYGEFRDFTVTKALEDLDTVVQFVKGQKFVKKSYIGITGTSLGGLVLMIYATYSDPQAIVPVSAPFGLEDTNVMRDEEAVRQWKEHGFKYFYVRTKGGKKERKALSYNFIVDRSKYDMFLLLEKVKSPVLVVHGDKDDFVPVSHANQYYENLKTKKKLVVLKGAGHNFQFTGKEKKKVFAETLGWFKKYLKY